MKQNGPKVDCMKQNGLKWIECVPKGLGPNRPKWTKVEKMEES